MRWIRNTFVPHRDAHGTLLTYDGLIQDITERKRSEEALHTSEAFLDSLLNAIPVPVFYKDADGIYLGANKAFELFMDTTREQLIGKTVFDISPQEQAETHHAMDIGLVERGGGQHYETKVKDGQGELRDVILNKAVFTNDKSVIVGLIGAIIDITDLRKAQNDKFKLQAQLQQAQKMESLGILAGGVAHDMNNVLGAILGLASASIASQPPGSSAHQVFGTIIKAAERGGKMVKSLLSLARQSPVETHELDVNRILQEEAHLLERTTLSRVRLDLGLAAELRTIRGDASSLSHAFMNLFINAVDAMPESGTLRLGTRNLDGDWIEVVVEDTGTGMGKEVLEKAMDPFFTTKPSGKGTGLGLSMVYNTVKAHRGQMEIQSEPGHGTRVLLRFPACGAGAQATEPAVVLRPDASPGALNVLLVDDDELIQSSTHGILQVLGHTVTGVFSGEEALALLEAGLPTDVVILDLNMPGLGGAGTLPRLRALRPTVPVLLATGRADQAALDLVHAHPQVTLLPKPFSMGELQQCLQRLGRRQT
jgi:PAS domain S-box-containing protein